MGDNTPIYRNLQVYLDRGVRRVTMGKLLIYADDLVYAAGEGSTIHLESPNSPTMVVPADARKDARVVSWDNGEATPLTYLGIKIRKTDA